MSVRTVGDLPVQPGPLLREDFPPLPAGCVGWMLRSPSGGTTVYVADRPDTDWPELLEFLNRFPLCWRIEANEENNE